MQARRLPKETAAGERRVALVPDVVKQARRARAIEVVVEPGAGAGALIPDDAFADAGAQHRRRRGAPTSSSRSRRRRAEEIGRLARRRRAHRLPRAAAAHPTARRALADAA